jgi:hypothetical protein
VVAAGLRGCCSLLRGCCAQKIAELTEENERLKAGLDAHGTLRLIYTNPQSPEGNRIKAAAAALPVEKPKLTSEPRPLELTAEPERTLEEIH